MFPSLLAVGRDALAQKVAGKEASRDASKHTHRHSHTVVSRTTGQTCKQLPLKSHMRPHRTFVSTLPAGTDGWTAA